jgi:hypothetical protein
MKQRVKIGVLYWWIGIDGMVHRFNGIKPGSDEREAATMEEIEK